MLAFRDLFREKAVPVTRAWRALHVFRLHAAALQVREIVGIVDVVDHVLGNAAAAEVASHRLDLHGMDTRPAVDDLTISFGSEDPRPCRSVPARSSGRCRRLRVLLSLTSAPAETFRGPPRGNGYIL